MVEGEHELQKYLQIRSSYAPSFHQSGRSIAYISDTSGVPQVWSMDPDGGAPRQVTTLDERISAAVWSPSGKSLLFTMDTSGDERHQLYLLADGPEATVVSLTQLPEAMHIFGCWSPDGSAIAFAANRRDPAFFDVCVQEVPDGEPRMVYQQDGSNSVLAWSPDGRYLIVSHDNTYIYNDLLLLDLRSGDARPLTPTGGLAAYGSINWSPDGSGFYLTTNREREFNALAWMDVVSGEIAVLSGPPWDVEGLALSPDGTRLAYVVNEDGYSRPIVRDLSNQTDTTVEGLPPGTLYDPRRVTHLAWSPDSNRLAFAVNGPANNADIWLHDAAPGMVERITHSDTAGIAPDSFVQPHQIKFPTFDGREIPALLYTPEGASPDGGNPVVVLIHGGPEAQERPVFNSIYQYLVRQGLCVLAPNVRGSAGYGRTYIHLDDVRKRMDSVHDIEYAWKWLVDSGWADSDRMGVMGGSYGGFMTLATITTYPDLWAAAVELYGMSNVYTFLQNTSSYRRKLREMEYGDLEKDADFLTEVSPINRVDRIRTPLLVLHGATDPRVPISETEQMVETMRERGMEVEYIRFDDEGHGFLRPANQLKAYSTITDFLVRRLIPAV